MTPEQAYEQARPCGGKFWRELTEHERYMLTRLFNAGSAETARLREELALVNGDKLMLASELAARSFELESARAELARVAAMACIIGCDSCHWAGPVEYHNGHLIDGEGDEQCDGNERALTTPPAPVSPKGEER